MGLFKMHTCFVSCSLVSDRCEYKSGAMGAEHPSKGDSAFSWRLTLPPQLHSRQNPVNASEESVREK